jgi:hypothetical protein
MTKDGQEWSREARGHGSAPHPRAVLVLVEAVVLRHDVYEVLDRGLDRLRVRPRDLRPALARRAALRAVDQLAELAHELALLRAFVEDQAVEDGL